MKRRITIRPRGTTAAEIITVLAKALTGRGQAAAIIQGFGVMSRMAARILRVNAIAELGQQVLDQNISTSHANNLKNGANLIIEDGSGKQFIKAFGVYDHIGIVQPCNPSGTMALRSQPSNKSQIIRQLSADERLGVFDLSHQNGWRHVTTLGGEAGWVHGNCLFPSEPVRLRLLPRKGRFL